MFVYWCRFGRYSKRNRFTFLALLFFFNWTYAVFLIFVWYSTTKLNIPVLHRHWFVLMSALINFGVQEKPHWISNANRKLWVAKKMKGNHSSSTCLYWLLDLQINKINKTKIREKNIWWCCHRYFGLYVRCCCCLFFLVKLPERYASFQILAQNWLVFIRCRSAS